MADKTALIKEAQKYLAKGQIDKAIGEWEKLVSEYPDGNNFNFIGDLYLKKGDKRSATESYQKAANFFRQEGFSLKALALFKKVLNVSPADAAALYALGELSEEKELITDAIRYYLATADSLAKDGKKDELLDVYEKILSLSPANIPLRVKVAEILLKEGLKSGAAKEFLTIAGIYDDKGDIQKAKEYCQKVIEMQPLNKDAFIRLGSLHEKAGEMTEAADLMKEAAVVFHDSVYVLLRAAEISLAAGSLEYAKSYLYKIIDLEPKNATARRLLGEIYAKEGFKDKAWEEYLVVLDAMMNDGKYDDAVKLLENIREISPLEIHKRLISLYKQLGKDPLVVEELISMGDFYYEREMHDEALACYGEALEKAPDNDYLQERLAELKKDQIEEVPEFAGTAGPSEIFEPSGKETSEHISIKGEKTLDEIFTEADIFVRYGLLSEARELLEGLRLKAPESIDLHLRLKNVYADVDDKESAVTECLILSELYKRRGDAGESEKVLREGYGIYPDDPRLAERGFADLLEPTSLTAKSYEKFGGTSAGEGPSIEDYEEELSEADFYARQGLVQEAFKILLKLKGLFPESRDVADRLEALGGEAGLSEATGPSVSMEKHDGSFELPEEEIEISESAFTNEISQAAQTLEDSLEPTPEETLQEIPGQTEYEDFSIGEQDIVEAQEMPEAKLDDDVLDIFQEFKKGLESELEDEDSETHYNLGIAYKEMGLVDDAIKEFQTSGKDKKRFLQSSSMLGVCYMEKGLYSLAIDVLNKTLESIQEKDDSYWSIKYDLAEAHEKEDNLKKALDLYTEVYGWNAKFRNVSEKVSLLKTQTAKSAEKEKPKGRKDRVSYL
jgi:tetratricopeptide (TPR) repeat protein